MLFGVEITPSPRNAETFKLAASRDAETATMVHELDRSYARSYQGSSGAGAHLLVPSRRGFVLTKAVNGITRYLDVRCAAAIYTESTSRLRLDGHIECAASLVHHSDAPLGEKRAAKAARRRVNGASRITL